MAKSQRYLISVRGHDYVLSKHEEGLSQVLVLLRDGAEVAREKTSGQRVTLRSEERDVKVVVRLTQLGRVRRATLHVEGVEVDLDPEPGSAAARMEEKARERPGLYAARHVVTAAGGVLLPLLGIGLLINLVMRWFGGLLPDVDGPDLPSLPSPDLPDVPLPDWDLPDWQLSGWAQALLAASKLIVPILIAAGVAVHEVRRRRAQDELKERLREEPSDEEPTGRRTDQPSSRS